MHMRLRFLLILLLSFFFTCEAACTPVAANQTYGAYGFHYKQVSAGWGMSYREDGDFYHQFVVEYAKYYSGCLNRSFKGYGASATFFGDSNYAFGVKYYKALRRYSGHMLMPYLGVSPSLFRFESGNGVNVKPLLGLKFSPLYGGAVGLDMDLWYGYEVPVIAQRAFTAGRHDFSATLSVSVNIEQFLNLFSEERNVTEKF